MRAARLQWLLADVWGAPACRDGSGRIAETSPAAALAHWGLTYRGYKGAGREGGRGEIVDGLLAAAPWLGLEAVAERCRASDHELDAVVCAVIGLATLVGGTGRPVTAGDVDAARREGWIHVPTVSLGELGVLVAEVR